MMTDIRKEIREAMRVMREDPGLERVRDFMTPGNPVYLSRSMYYEGEKARYRHDGICN